MVEAGLEASLYVDGRMVERVSRSDAVDELESILKRKTGDQVNVNELIRVYWSVYHLHGADLASLPEVPYRLLRLACALAVQRVNRDFVLVPGKEKALQNAWKEIIKKRMTAETACGYMRGVIRVKQNKVWPRKQAEKKETLEEEEREMKLVDERMKKREFPLLAIAAANVK